MNTPEKIEAKRAQLLNRTAAALDVTISEAEKLFAVNRLSSFRINRLKVDDDLSLLAELHDAGWRGKQSSYYQYGYSIETGRDVVVASEAARDGRLFIQNQASWLAVLALDPREQDAVLDMCAAPGGKATFIAELTINQAILTVNDSSKERLYKLRANFERLGCHYDKLTMFTLERLKKELPAGGYNKILLDAPCSGEGMMDLSKDYEFEYWSLAQIKRLHQLQKKSIATAWRLLKPGGTLVYSTCTMAPEENEAVIDYLLSHNADAALVDTGQQPTNRYPALQKWGGRIFRNDLTHCLRLAPSPFVEAFFVAKVIKLSPQEVRYTDYNE